MGKIDLEKVVHLSRIIAGEESKLERPVSEASGIDFKRVKKLDRIIAGEEKLDRLAEKLEKYKKAKGIQNMGPGPGNETEKFLFFYTTWTFVENKSYRTLTESEAIDKLKEYSSEKMETVYCKFKDSSTPMPAILEKRKGLQTEIVMGHDQVSELIYRKTGVSVPESDLMTKKNQQPLGIRMQAFVKSIDERKIHDKEVQRIYNCLLENDLKRRNECLRNCKIK